MFFLPLIISIIITVVLISNLYSFRIQNYNPYKYDDEIVHFIYQQEHTLIHSINEFILYEKSFPTNISDLINNDYLSKYFISSTNTSLNSISFSLIDGNSIQISHHIENDNIRQKYLNSYLNNTSSLSDATFKSYQPFPDDPDDKSLIYHNYYINQKSLDVLTYSTGSISTTSLKLHTCKDILDNNPLALSGKYRSDLGFDIYCDMTTDGGGWTLVLSNVKDLSGSPHENLSFTQFTSNSKPFYNNDINSNLYSFETTVPLNLWNYFIKKNNPLNPNFGELFYKWEAFEGAPSFKKFNSTIQKFSSHDNYTLKLSNASGGLPDLFNYHNNKPLSTFDFDNDQSIKNCSYIYRDSPFWFFGDLCASGSIFGYSSLFHGAYWVGNLAEEGQVSGEGVGSGWIFIR